jgi:hypothetical protein
LLHIAIEQGEDGAKLGAEPKNRRIHISAYINLSGCGKPLAS